MKSKTTPIRRVKIVFALAVGSLGIIDSVSAGDDMWRCRGHYIDLSKQDARVELWSRNESYDTGRKRHNLSVMGGWRTYPIWEDRIAYGFRWVIDNAEYCYDVSHRTTEIEATQHVNEVNRIIENIKKKKLPLRVHISGSSGKAATYTSDDPTAITKAQAKPPVVRKSTRSPKQIEKTSFNCNPLADPFGVLADLNSSVTTVTE